MKTTAGTIPYSDILDHPHYQSRTRQHMSMMGRAAQFAPFAALSGYDDAIKETGRHTEGRMELSADQIELLNDQLHELHDQIRDHPMVTFTYFREDPRKEGGSYETVTGKVKNIDSFFCYIVLEDNTLIPVADIIEIDKKSSKSL